MSLWAILSAASSSTWKTKAVFKVEELCKLNNPTVATIRCVTVSRRRWTSPAKIEPSLTATISPKWTLCRSRTSPSWKTACWNAEKMLFGTCFLPNRSRCRRRRREASCLRCSSNFDSCLIYSYNVRQGSFWRAIAHRTQCLIGRWRRVTGCMTSWSIWERYHIWIRVRWWGWTAALKWRPRR